MSLNYIKTCKVFWTTVLRVYIIQPPLRFVGLQIRPISILNPPSNLFACLPWVGIAAKAFASLWTFANFSGVPLLCLSDVPELRSWNKNKYRGSHCFAVTSIVYVSVCHTWIKRFFLFQWFIERQKMTLSLIKRNTRNTWIDDTQIDHKIRYARLMKKGRYVYNMWFWDLNTAYGWVSIFWS
jgi:hypothetical protein